MSSQIYYLTKNAQFPESGAWDSVSSAIMLWLLMQHCVQTATNRFPCHRAMRTVHYYTNFTETLLHLMSLLPQENDYYHFAYPHTCWLSLQEVTYSMQKCIFHEASRGSHAWSEELQSSSQCAESEHTEQGHTPTVPSFSFSVLQTQARFWKGQFRLSVRQPGKTSKDAPSLRFLMTATGVKSGNENCGDLDTVHKHIYLYSYTTELTEDLPQKHQKSW